MKVHRGAAEALLAAALFGISIPLAKLLVQDFSPWMLAGLLYLGSGLGLGLLRLLPRLWQGAGMRQESHLRGSDWVWLLAAIAFGGMAGPVLLMAGLARTNASTAALLLNLEGVFTATLAWFVFKEGYDRRIILGMVAITGGALLLAWPGAWSLTRLWGPLAVALACLAWGIDNNLTRRVLLHDPVQIAIIKGCVAGTANLVIAWLDHGVLPGHSSLLLAGLLGFFGYGASLVFFMRALRHIGVARTGAYFSMAPFVGALLGLVLLSERLTFRFSMATALMLFGIWLHLTEHHEHDHEHEELNHEHAHVHDPHHGHPHDEYCPDCEPHCHWHIHFPLVHNHGHFPDPHHRHRH